MKCLIRRNYRNTRRLKYNRLHARLIGNALYKLNRSVQIERIDSLDRRKPYSSKDLLYIYLCNYLAHHGVAGARMRLVTGHGSSRVVQNDKRHVGLIVDCIYHACDRRSEEGRITHKCKALRVRLDVADALSDIYACAHTEAGVNHVERHGISEGVTADIAAENSLSALHSLLHCVEGCPVRAACAENRRTNRKLWNVCGFRLVGRCITFGRCIATTFRLIGICFLVCTNKRLYVSNYTIYRILSGVCRVAGKLAANLNLQIVFAANIGELPLDDRIKLLKAENLALVLQEFCGLLLRERKRRAYLHKRQLACNLHGLQRVCEAYTARCNSETPCFTIICRTIISRHNFIRVTYFILLVL